eukprot:TRINITY_DN67530_c5_g1_i1.p1 TRINITY_DN67530_c5_g1~~TRINITY_DN67530_c5_g1_i1.p1  ORF type:complete len:951 (+),score=111.01 TRINITY_DN67530_c5_g1_i1:70-2922(+)
MSTVKRPVDPRTINNSTRTKGPAKGAAPTAGAKPQPRTTSLTRKPNDPTGTQNPQGTAKQAGSFARKKTTPPPPMQNTTGQRKEPRTIAAKPNTPPVPALVPLTPPDGSNRAAVLAPGGLRRHPSAPQINPNATQPAEAPASTSSSRGSDKLPDSRALTPPPGMFRSSLEGGLMAAAEALNPAGPPASGRKAFGTPEPSSPASNTSAHSAIPAGVPPEVAMVIAHSIGLGGLDTPSSTQERTPGALSTSSSSSSLTSGIIRKTTTPPTDSNTNNKPNTQTTQEEEKREAPIESPTAVTSNTPSAAERKDTEAEPDKETSPPEPEQPPLSPRTQIINKNNELEKKLREVTEKLQSEHNMSHIEKWQNTITQMHNQAEAALKEFEEGVKCIEEIDTSTWEEKYHLSVSEDELFAEQTKPNLVDVDRHLCKLREMKMTDESAPFQECLDNGIELLKKVEIVLRGSKLHSKQWSTILAPALMHLQNAMQLPTIDACTANTLEERKRAKFLVEEKAHEQQEAISEGNMVDAEARYYEKIRAQEMVSTLTTALLPLYEECRLQTYERPLKQLKDSRNDMNSRFAELSRNNTKFRTRLQTDLENLQSVQSKMEENYKEKTADLEGLVAKSGLLLNDNWTKQQKCWATIQEMQGELEQLAKERALEVQRRTKALTDNLYQKTEYEMFHKLSSERCKLVELSLQNCDQSDEITDILSDSVTRICHAIEFYLRSREMDIAQRITEAQQEHLDGFRSLYLTVGELVYRKEQHAAAMDKKIEMARIQQEILMDSLNPQAKEMADMRKALQKSKNDIDAAINELHTKQQHLQIGFKPTEEALQAKGIEFSHPVEELEKINESRKMKILEYHQLSQAQIAEGEAVVAHCEQSLKQAPACARLLREHQVASLNSTMRTATTAPISPTSNASPRAEVEGVGQGEMKMDVPTAPATTAEDNAEQLID